MHKAISSKKEGREGKGREGFFFSSICATH
jgi:hypothetical protein